MPVAVDVDRVGADDAGQIGDRIGDRREVQRAADRAVVAVQDCRRAAAGDVQVGPAVAVAVEDRHPTADRKRERALVGVRRPDAARLVDEVGRPAAVGTRRWATASAHEGAARRRRGNGQCDPAT